MNIHDFCNQTKVTIIFTKERKGQKEGGEERGRKGIVYPYLSIKEDAHNNENFKYARNRIVPFL